MMDCALRFSLLAAFFFLAGDGRAEPSPDALATAVIYNRADPSSEKIAEYYAKRRNIPAEHLVGLDCSAQETITRLEYESTIAAPLRRAFLQKGWWVGGTETGGVARIVQTKIRYVALIRGIPLKIQHDPSIAGDPSLAKGIGERNEASVDSEIACLGLGPANPSGPAVNSYYRRYTRILDWKFEPGLLLVCRLDGFSEISVRAMIDDALMAERDGLWGWAYVDGRNIREGGYAEGDRWLSKAAEEMRRQGIPVLFDEVEATLPAGYPITDAAIYYGWYAGEASGPFAASDFRFRPGAIAVHIHSFSASTLRDPRANWCAPLIEHGVAATLGNVYEPYLALTANLDVFQDRLMSGFTLAESAYMGTRSLSWMSVVIGDPLYRPYAAWNEMQFGEADEPSTSWAEYRRIVRTHDGDVVTAAPELLAAAQRTGKSMFLEALAAAQIAAGKKNEALASLNAALKIEKEPLVAFRLALGKILLLRSMGDSGAATEIITAWLPKAPGEAQAALLREILGQLHPPPPPSPSPAK